MDRYIVDVDIDGFNRSIIARGDSQAEACDRAEEAAALRDVGAESITAFACWKIRQPAEEGTP